MKILLYTALICLAQLAYTQKADSLIWESLQISDESVVPSGTTVQSIAGLVDATITWHVIDNGENGNFSYSDKAGFDFVTYDAQATDGEPGGQLSFGIDNDAFDPEDRLIVEITFSQPVEGLCFRAIDVDQSSWDDALIIYADSQNIANNPDLFDLGTCVTVDEGAFEGLCSSPSEGVNASNGNVNINFACNQAVSTLRFEYFTGNDVNVNPAPQRVHIGNFGFSPFSLNGLFIDGPTDICASDDIAVFTASRADGVFSSPVGEALVDNGDGTAFFFPQETGSGSYSVIYTVVDSICPRADTFQVNVHIEPVVFFNVAFTACINQGLIELKSGYPLGGTYSGKGISGNSFNPAVAGIDTHQIVYTVVDINGCFNTDTSTIVVRPPKSVDAGLDFTICPGDSVTLFASGDGDISWSDGIENGTAFLPMVGDDEQITENTSFSYVARLMEPEGCFVLDTIIVTVKSEPICSISAPDTVSSFGLPFVASAHEAMVVYTWNVSDEEVIISPFLTNDSSTRQIQVQPGRKDFVLTLIAEDFDGCESQCEKLITVIDNADLSLEKTVIPTKAAIGDVVTFAITITNAGPSIATNVKFSDFIPTGYNNLSNPVNGFFTDSTFQGTIDTLDVGDTILARFAATLTNNPDYTNYAEITFSDQHDSDSTPNNGVEKKEDDTDSATIGLNTFGSFAYFGCSDDGFEIEIVSSIFNEANPIGTIVTTNAAGCDSIITIDLTFNAIDETTIIETMCSGSGFQISADDMVFNEDNPFGIIFLTNQNGCDSIVTIDLSFTPSIQANFNPSICPTDTLLINGALYFAGNPTGQEVFIGSNGCDSIVNISLNILESIFIRNTIFTCDPGTGDASITNIRRLQSINGCDSIIEETLVFIPTSESSFLYEGCSGDGFEIVVGDSLFNELNPEGIILLPGQNGCDSFINVSLRFEDQVKSTITHDGCEGDGFTLTVAGHVFNEVNPAGSVDLVAASGCDSIVVIDLQFKPNGESFINLTACAGESIQFGGLVFNQENTNQIITIANGSNNGCDSIINVSVEFLPPRTSSLSFEKCTGSGFSIQVGTDMYNESNPSGNTTLVSASGCDSTITVSINFNQSVSFAFDYHGCQNDGFEIIVGNSLFNEENPFGSVELTTAEGCDSIIVVGLFYQESTTTNIPYSGCSGDGFEIIANGVAFNEANPAGSVTLTAESGCDSLVVFDFDFNAVSESNLTLISCSGEDIEIFGIVITEELPIRIILLPNAAASGCDSLVKVRVDFLPPIIENLTFETCSGSNFQVSIGDSTFSEINPPGTVVLQASNGCDSIINVSIDVIPPLTGRFDYQGCVGDGFTTTIDGQTFSENNPTGTITISNTAGCDSIVTVQLEFQAIPTIDTRPAFICDNTQINLSNFIDSGDVNETTFYYRTLDEALIGNNALSSSTIQASDFSLVVVRRENQGGCFAIDSIFIDLFNKDNFSCSSVALNPTCFGGNDGSIMIFTQNPTAVRFSIDGGQLFSANSTFTGLASGQYDIMVATEEGCRISCESVILGQPVPLQIVLDSVILGCKDNMASVYASGAGGTAPYQFNIAQQFFEGAMTGIFNNVPVNDYSLHVTDANGCTAEIDFLIEGPACTLPDLALTKTVNNITPTIGEDVVYTITITDESEFEAQGVVIEDIIPDGLRNIRNISSGGVYDGISIIWSNLSFTGLDSEVLIYTATVAGDPSLSNYKNRAQVIAMVGEDLDSQPNNDDGDQSEDDEDMVMLMPMRQMGDVELTKTVDNPRPCIGETIRFNIAVVNRSMTLENSVVVQDRLPAGFSNPVNISNNGIVINDGNIEWTVFSIQPNTLVNLSFEVTVVDGQPADQYINVAEITAYHIDDIDSEPNNDDGDQSEDDEDAVTVTPREPTIDLEIRKVADNMTPLLGTTVTYTVTLTNDGKFDATNVGIQDRLPDGIVDISNISNGGSFANQSVNWTIQTVPAGEDFILTYTALLTEDCEANFTNVAEIMRHDLTDIDSEPGNNQVFEDDQASLTIQPIAPFIDLELTKSIDNIMPRIGDEIEWQLTLLNRGEFPATGVQVVDYLPLGFSDVNAINQGGQLLNGQIVWNDLSLSSGDTILLTFNTTIEEILFVQDHTNIAQVTAQDQKDIDSAPANDDGDQSEDDEASFALMPDEALVDLSLSKAVSNSCPDLCEVFAFTITVKNNSRFEATGVSVLDKLPELYSSPDTVGSGGRVTPDGIEWRDLTIPAMGSVELTFPTSIMTYIRNANYTNFTEITRQDQEDRDSQPNNGPQNEDDEAQVAVTPKYIDLSIVKSVDNMRPCVGDVVNYTLTVTNSGNRQATGISVVDRIPAGIMWVAGISNEGVSAADTVAWSQLTLDTNTSIKLTYTARIDQSDSVNAYLNIAEITNADQKDVDSAPGNNVDSEDDYSTLTIDPKPPKVDLTLSKSTPSDDIWSKDWITFNIVVTNQSEFDATGVEITDRMPNGFTSVRSVSTGGRKVGSNVVWSDLTVPANSTIKLSLRTIVKPAFEHVNYQNVAEITAMDQIDPDSSPNNDNGDQSEDDEDYAAIIVNGVPRIDLSLSKEVDNPFAQPDDLVTFTITLTNRGLSKATNVAIQDVLPSGFKEVQGVSDGGQQNYNIVEWTGIDLNPGQSKTFSLRAVVVHWSISCDYINVAQVIAADQEDDDSKPGNDDGDQSEDDEAHAEVLIGTMADLSLTQRFSKDLPTAGDTVDIVVSACNNGPANAFNVSVQSEIGHGFDIIKIANKGVNNSGNITWSNITIIEGDCFDMTVTAVVKEPMVETSYFSLSQIVTSDQLDPNSTPGNEDGDQSEDDESLIMYDHLPVVSIASRSVASSLEINILLEGAMIESELKSNFEMKTTLNDGGYLPGQIPNTFLGKASVAGQPFNVSPWFYEGIEGVDADDNYYDSDIVDWVLVKLWKDGVAQNFETFAALITSHGELILTDKTVISVEKEAFYWISIEHRNHLPTVSPYPVPVGKDGTLSFDFTQQQSFTGLLGFGQKEIDGRFVMFAGNGEQFITLDSPLDINTMDLQEWIEANGQNSSYFLQDYDMNGDVNIKDRILMMNNMGIFSSQK